MIKQGGGVTGHAGVEIYVDLIVGDLSSIESEYPQTADLFAAFAKHRQGPSNFGYAEIEKDNRLLNKLSKTKEGLQFFNKIKADVPLITVSNSILGDVDNIKNVKLFSLTDIEKNPLDVLNKITDSVSFKAQSEKMDFLDGIDKLNKILAIKPGFFGISINVNVIIEGWLKKKRSKSNST